MSTNVRFPPIANIAAGRHYRSHDSYRCSGSCPLPHADVNKVTFYKRDEITTDLICCDVVTNDQVWTLHEELVGWKALIDHLQRLPGFDPEWFAAVSTPPFATSETVAFTRQ
jgi:hypothetical protein